MNKTERMVDRNQQSLVLKNDYTPYPYDYDEVLSTLEREINKLVEQALGSHVDAANGNMLDNYIDHQIGMLRKTIADKNQRDMRAVEDIASSLEAIHADLAASFELRQTALEETRTKIMKTETEIAKEEM